MPHNGELYFAIHNAHTKAVSTVVVTTDGIKLISGGCDGQVITTHYAFYKILIICYIYIYISQILFI